MRILQLITILGILAGSSCHANEFQASPLRIGHILIKARELIEVSSVDVSTSEGRIGGVTICCDTRKAAQYLKSHWHEFQKCYEFVKEFTAEDNRHYVDALYVMALANKITYIWTKSAIEHNCRYANRIMKLKEANPTAWILDKIFGPMMTEKGFPETWDHVENREKQRRILEFLAEGCGTGADWGALTRRWPIGDGPKAPIKTGKG